MEEEEKKTSDSFQFTGGNANAGIVLDQYWGSVCKSVETEFNSFFINI